MSKNINEFKTFGVVGYGHFGRFLADSLAHHGSVRVFDQDPAQLPEKDTQTLMAAPIGEVVCSDVVIVAVGLHGFESALREIQPHLQPETVVMDVMSTKKQATDLMTKLLNEHENFLSTHPLFGPPSMEELKPGQRLVVTYQKGKRAKAFLDYLTNTFGTKIIHMSPEKHDTYMAYMQSLPFFIARALMEMDITRFPDKLSIPSFEKLVMVANIEKQHTQEMFETSQLSNPYSSQARAELLKALQKLHSELEGEEQT